MVGRAAIASKFGEAGGLRTPAQAFSEWYQSTVQLLSKKSRGRDHQQHWFAHMQSYQSGPRQRLYHQDNGTYPCAWCCVCQSKV